MGSNGKRMPKKSAKIPMAKTTKKSPAPQAPLPPESKSEVLNLRVTPTIKARLITESIRDSRSVSRIAERALMLGLNLIEKGN
jgi:hypothetical protein